RVTNNRLELNLRAFASAHRSYGTRWAICRPRCRADSLLCDRVQADASEGRLPRSPRLKLSARGGRFGRKAQGEVLYLDCGRRRPQLRLDPLGGTHHCEEGCMTAALLVADDAVRDAGSLTFAV